MEFSPNVTILERGPKKFYIVGTAHISQKSVDEVQDVIEKVKPDTVCVELCPTRHKALTDDQSWRSLNIFQVIRQGKALFLLANLALASFQRKMGEKLGVKPGAELLAAVHKADEVGAKLVLADRDIQITLKRTWHNLPFWRKMTVLGGLVESVFSSQEISEEELEELKDRDQLSDMMHDFAKTMPELKEPLINERDQYLMSNIEEAEGEKIVAVVGAGHVAGMTDWFGKKVDRTALDRKPPKSKWVEIIKWLAPILVLSLFYVGYHKHQGEGLKDMLIAWILPNSVFAAVLTLAAGARLLSVITAFFASPITSLNPAIGAGMVVGLVEAWLRKPTVADCEMIQEDIKTVRGFYTNRFTKVLLVFFMSTLGSALGSWVGITWLVSLGAS